MIIERFPLEPHPFIILSPFHRKYLASFWPPQLGCRVETMGWDWENPLSQISWCFLSESFPNMNSLLYFAIIIWHLLPLGHLVFAHCHKADLQQPFSPLWAHYTQHCHLLSRHPPCISPYLILLWPHLCNLTIIHQKCEHMGCIARYFIYLILS